VKPDLWCGERCGAERHTCGQR